MARGRFISKEITIDKKVNNLSSAWSMLAFTWLLTHTDGYGRVYGDPAVVRALIFPRRSDVTVEDMEGYIREWNEAGLVNWYEVAGDMYIEFPNFKKHQLGLQLSKEAKSNIPPNPENSINIPEIPNNLPENSGKLPENSGGLPPECNVKLSISEVECKDEVVVNGDCGDLITEFSRITSIEYPRGRKAETEWDYPLSELKKRGLTINDMRVAIKELDAKKYAIVSPKSIFTACDMVLNRRKRKGDEGYAPISADSQFANAVIH